MKNFVQKGGAIQHTAGAAIASGDVVEMSHILGVAQGDAAIGESVAVEIEGVFELPKVSGAVFAQGEKLIWDTSAGAFDDAAATPATGDITGAGIAVQAGANGETTCRVLLTPGNADLA